MGEICEALDVLLFATEQRIAQLAEIERRTGFLSPSDRLWLAQQEGRANVLRELHKAMAEMPREAPTTSIMKAMQDTLRPVRIQECRGRHPPEWNAAEERWVCAKGCGPLDARDRTKGVRWL